MRVYNVYDYLTIAADLFVLGGNLAILIWGLSWITNKLFHTKTEK